MLQAQTLVDHASDKGDLASGSDHFNVAAGTYLQELSDGIGTKGMLYLTHR